MPYRFLEDIATADVAFEATAGSREGLFVESATALLHTTVADPATVERHRELTIDLEEHDFDLLLFAFLQELVFLKDARRLLLHADELQIDEADGGYRLRATVRGEEIDRGRHPLIVDVKAVTLHRFRAGCENGVWRAVVVLDV
jgi:SHS2 domain-containing protein